MSEYRELGERCFEMFDTVPGLRELFDGVRKDEDLRWEVRPKNCLTCYYKSGKMFEMKLSPKYKKPAFDFDHNYFCLDDEHRAMFADLEKWHTRSPNEPREWLKQLNPLKAVMDEWKLEKKANREAGAQQALTRCNTFAAGSWQYIDTEFAVPGYRRDFGQIDMVAVRKEGKQYIPVLVELKHGTKEFHGEHGIRAHYDKYIRFLTSPDGEVRFVETIQRIWKTKLRLGLLAEPVPDKTAFGEAELLFAVTGWQNGNAEVVRGLLPDKLERKVRVAISEIEELYFDNSVLLAQR